MKQYPKPQINEGDFLNSINRAIKEKRHVEYLSNVITDYEQYKQFFELQAFSAHNPRGYIYQFKVVYRHDRKVWRLIEVKGNQTLEKFAEAIIDSMDWVDDHMHSFTFPDANFKNWQYARSIYTIFCDAEGWEDDPFPTLKTNQVRIDDIDYDVFPRLNFEFDFGDNHEFDIEIKRIRGPKAGEVKASFPRILQRKGQPPEQYPNYNDEESDEGAMVSGYIQFHDNLPIHVTDKDIARAIETLQGVDQEPESIKLSILILAHTGTEEACQTLSDFRDRVDGELAYWADTAIGECRLFMNEETMPHD